MLGITRTYMLIALKIPLHSIILLCNIYASRFVCARVVYTYLNSGDKIWVCTKLPSYSLHH